MQQHSKLSGKHNLDKLHEKIILDLPKTPEKPFNYDLVRALLREVKASACLPYYTEYIHDINAELVSKCSRWSRSFIQGFVGVLNAQLEPSSAGISLTDTGGTGRTLIDNAAAFNAEGGSGVDTRGIVWGTGTNAEATTNTALQTQIAEGTGAGQLSHGSTSIGGYSAGASSTTITVTRSATNNSGSGITVEERGLYHSGGNSSFDFCGIRDVAQQAVLDTETITTVYTLDFAL